MIYIPELLASDGSGGVYVFIMSYSPGFGLANIAYTVIAASMPLLEDNFALFIPTGLLPVFQSDVALYLTSRLNPLFEEDVYPDTDFLSLN